MRTRLCLGAVFVLASLSPISASAYPHGLADPKFTEGAVGQVPPGWHVPKAAQDGFRATLALDGDGRRCVALTHDAGADDFGNLMQTVDASHYRGKYVRYRMAVRAQPSNGGRVELWLRVDRPNGRIGYFDNMYDRPIVDPHRRYYEIDGDVAADAVDIAVGVIVFGKAKAWVDDASLTTTDIASVNSRPIRTLDGPGVIDVTAQAAVKLYGRAKSGIVTFPIPGLYREQEPLAFHVSTTPSTALRGYRWRRRADGLNWVCEVTASPPPKGAVVRWEELVLVDDRPVAALPKVPLPLKYNYRADAAWLASTACVQSTDPAIRAKAAELLNGAGDLETYVRRVVQFTSKNTGKPGEAFTSLDARRALDCGGSCTSRANLAAALLRAAGIPARTVAHMPAWTNGQKLYEHWLVEYRHPGVGWVWIEPTLGQMQPSPSTVVVLAVSSAADENRAFDPVHLRYVMPGAAYLSVCELSKELTGADLFDTDAVNLATPVARVSGPSTATDRLFRVARRHFSELAAQGERGAVPDRRAMLLKAAKTGSPSALAAALAR